MRLALAFLVVATLAGCRFEARPALEPDAPPVTDASVTVYVTEWCPYCQATREYLDDIGVEYRAVDIESSAEAYQEYQGEGGTGGIPLVVIGDTRFEGFSEPAIDQALERAGL